MRFWAFIVVGIGPVGYVYCQTYSEALSFVRKTWTDKWKVIPNGVYD